MKRINLTEGGIIRNIIMFSLPYTLSYFLQLLYGLTDLFVIGRYCDVDSTTAVSNGAQVMYMFTVVIIGLAMGTTVRIARAVGSGNNRRIAFIIGNTVTLFAIAAVILTIILLCLRHNIVTWIDTPTEAVSGTLDYLTVCFLGIPFIVAYNVISSIFRGMGDSRSPMYFVAIACVVNITLNFLFIGHFGLGPMGSALATTLSQMISVIIAVITIRRHRSVLGVSRSDLKIKRGIVSDILKIGIPVAMQDGFIQVAFIVITVIANGRGLNDAAAVGIVEKVIGLLFIIPSAMLSTVSAISAQNIGAGKIERAKRTLRYAVYVCVGFGTISAITFQFCPELAVGIFTNNTDVISLGAEYLQSYVWDCILAGVHFCYRGFFTAMGYSLISFGHNFISIVCARIPLSFLASEYYPHSLYPMGLACPTGSLVSVLICLFVYYWMSKNNKLNMSSTSCNYL